MELKDTLQPYFNIVQITNFRAHLLNSIMIATYVSVQRQILQHEYLVDEGEFLKM